MDALLVSLWQLLVAVAVVVASLAQILLPWTPLIAWVVFWTFAVNWVKFREVLVNGGWTGVLLIGLAAVLVWGAIAPPVGGTYDVFGLTVSNYVGKTIFVTGLVCLMFLAGAVQLSGACGSCCHFPEETDEADEHHEHHAAHAHH